MLKESFSSKQLAHTPRRWFSDEYFDLIVWLDQKGTISGFQLCYDKDDRERALTWTDKQGYAHERVDDGESNPSKNRTPILVPDGLFPSSEILARFLSSSEEIDPQVRFFVVAKLREYHGRQGF
jgi:hypothetical protein